MIRLRLSREDYTLQPHGDSLGDGLSLLLPHPLALEERGKHQFQSTDARRTVEESYLMQVEVVKEVVPSAYYIGVQVIASRRLVLGEVDVFHKDDIIYYTAQQHPHALRIHHSVDLPRPHYHPTQMRISLRSHRDSGRHAGVTESLWVWQVATTVSINEVGLPAEWRHALPTGLAMLTLRFESLQVVAEFLVLEGVLAARADLVVGVQAGS